MKQKIYDVAVLGGGVVGASIYNALVKSQYSCVLIEKGSDVSTGATKANSAIIHAGFDAKSGTLKAKLNVEGNAMFPEICERLGITLKKIGAYVLGNNVEAVKELLKRGMQNGVQNLRFLGKNDLKKVIPNINNNITCGLFAEDTYIVNPYLLTICLVEEGIVNGGDLYLDFYATKITKNKDFFVITNGKKEIKARQIVNSCGANYNEVAKLLGAEEYPIVYRRGEYYILDNSEKNLVGSVVFPLPDAHSKGVLVTPTVDGNILVGPTSYESDDSTTTTEDGLNDIKMKANSLLNNIDLSKAIRVFSGVRSVVGEDFVIEKSKKVAGVINLAGICSPGLSSAPAIAKYVMDLLGLKYMPILRQEKIKPYTLLRDMDDKKINALIKSCPSYGKIVCKCERISEGEIVDAINRPFRPTTTDSIKRRVRAGMGRCQGAFCLDKVIKILAEQNQVSFNDVKKENDNSNWIVGDVEGGWNSEN